jgi:hypothetical protein
VAVVDGRARDPCLERASRAHRQGVVAAPLSAAGVRSLGVSRGAGAAATLPAGACPDLAPVRVPSRQCLRWIAPGPLRRPVVATVARACAARAGRPAAGQRALVASMSQD